MRHCYLLSYDIHDQKRLIRVHKLVKGYAEQVQYSVYIAVLRKSEIAQLVAQLRAIIKSSQDEILLIPLGPENGCAGAHPDNWINLGKKKEIPVDHDMIF